MSHRTLLTHSTEPDNRRFVAVIILLVGLILSALVGALPALGERTYPHRYQPAVLRAD